MTKSLTSVGLRVSGTHDSGEFTCNLMMLFTDVLFVGIRYTYGMREMRQLVRAMNI